MKEFCRTLPKAELHLHLEGTVEPETLQAIAPDLTPAAVRELYDFPDFPGFLECFKLINLRLRTPGDYALITRRMLKRLQEQNVSYAEVIIAAGVVIFKKQEFGPIFDAIEAEALRSPVEVRWILDAVRHLGAEHAMQVAELAAKRVESGVVAMGIGGDEVNGPAQWFSEVYAFSKARGLHLHAHAGEVVGPESIWAALELGVERIGHGIRAIDDPVLVRHLAEHNIPLEICVTSNVATGAVPAVASHPLRKLFDAGVPVTLGSDDPGVFGTWLCDEYELAAAQFGFSEAELREVAANGFRYAFDASAHEAARLAASRP